MPLNCIVIMATLILHQWYSYDVFARATNETTPTRTRSVQLKHEPYERDRCSTAR